MVFARHEMEYLGSIDTSPFMDPGASVDATMIDEMWHRLDALRCHDQDFDADDWRPRAVRPGTKSRRRD
ncbi:MAG TPA: hypothetical protein VH107_04500 [Lacipirellulaceae bacterium]|nr:hypothetical protein [Lacipirellulaceae bacterium]